MNTVILGYWRVSTPTQNAQRQIRNITQAYEITKMYCDKYTGTKTTRKGFQDLLNDIDKLIKKDNHIIVVFDSVSRMSRNATEGIEIYEKLFNKGVELVFIKEPHINTSVYKNALNNQIAPVGIDIADAYIETTNKVLLMLAKKQVQIAFEQAEKEVQDLHKRTSEGMLTAKLNGKQIGLVKGTKLTTKKSIQAKEQILKYSKFFNGTLNDKEVMQMTGLARNTYYKYKADLLNN